jgi:ubiquinone/menaquinone biosynthesis C-methylase UbiE
LVADDNDVKRLSRQRFSRYAQGYVSSRTHAEGAELDRLLEIAQPQADWLVLDVATGGGHTALKFAPCVAGVIATDISESMLDAAQAFLSGLGVQNVTYKVADAEALSFEDATFDLVTCRIAAHHFSDCPRFVGECARVLKPAGMLLVQDHVLPDDAYAAAYVESFQKLRDPSHSRAYTEGEWRDMFVAAGFAVEHTEQILKEHPFMSWARRQGCTQEIIDRLTAMLAEAPQAVVDWMQPRDIGTPEASFSDYHIIIAGSKPRLGSV